MRTNKIVEKEKHFITEEVKQQSAGKPEDVIKNPKEKRTREFLKRYINVGGN